jgi:hypothetical protein
MLFSVHKRRLNGQLVTLMNFECVEVVREGDVLVSELYSFGSEVNSFHYVSHDSIRLFRVGT